MTNGLLPCATGADSVSDCRVKHAVLTINKPSGLTSHQVVSRVRKALGAAKAGHAGTLDPLATGVLIVCLNEATKITRFLLDMDKRYRARLKLGEKTDTLDAEGQVIETRGYSFVSADDIARTIKKYEGFILQKPPMYSAVKVGGRPLYKLARKGVEVERPYRNVRIYGISVIGFSLPYVDIEVSCSKGTYVRTLCDDIGTDLGTGAHLVSLERTGIGFFSIDDSAGPDDLMSGTISMDGRFLHSIDEALSGMRELPLDEHDSRRVKNGTKIQLDNTAFSENENVRLKDNYGVLFGIGRVVSGIVRVERILNL